LGENEPAFAGQAALSEKWAEFKTNPMAEGRE